MPGMSLVEAFAMIVKLRLNSRFFLAFLPHSLAPIAMHSPRCRLIPPFFKSSSIPASECAAVLIFIPPRLRLPYRFRYLTSSRIETDY
jgi:hypothetical protein